MIMKLCECICFCGISGIRHILCQDDHLNIPGLRIPPEPAPIHRGRFRVPKGIHLLVLAPYPQATAVFRGNFDSNTIYFEIMNI